MKKIQKKQRRKSVQASTYDEWREADRPNYSTNTDLNFAYSEYPRTFGDKGYEFYSIKFYTWDLNTRIVDFWGEGRIDDDGMITGFTNAYNINHQFQLVSNGKDKYRKIPNRIPTIDYDDVSVAKYIPDHSISIITLMGAPINKQTAAEMARMISGELNSVIVIYGKEEGSKEIITLEVELDLRNYVLYPSYPLNNQLNEVTLTPSLAFCTSGNVIDHATVYFNSGDMSKCATILCSLQRSGYNQQCAKAALTKFFAQDNIKNSYRIFKLGYTLKTTTEGPAIMKTYMNSNVVRIVQLDYASICITSNFSTVTASLCTNGKISSGSWQWGFFGSSGYISDPGYNGGQDFTLASVNSGETFKLRADFGSPAYLCVNGKVSAGSWQWALFGATTYVDPSYNGGYEFRLIPVNGGSQFKIQASYGETAWLCVNGKVSAGSWQWAFFGSAGYLNGSSYQGGDVFTITFS